MAWYSDIYRVPAAATVTTVGTGPNDGWSLVARLPQSRLPAVNSGYSFLVVGKFGRFAASGAQPTAGIVQIRVGSSAGTVHPGFIAQASINDPSIGDLAQPFAFLVHVNSQVADALWGSAWSGSFDLCVYARTYLNGDPQAYAPSFDVADIAFQWWHTTAIPAGKWQAGSETAIALSPGPGWTTRISGPTAIGSTGQRWLCQQTMQFQSSGAIVPQLQAGYTRNSSPAQFTSKIGSVRLGAPPRGTFLAGRESPTHSWPILWQEVLPDATVRVSWQGRDPAGSTPFTAVQRHQWIAVRIDDMPDVAAVESASRPAMLTQNNVETGLYPFEPVVARNVLPVAMFYCVHTPRVRSYHSWQIRVNDGRQAWRSTLAVQARDASEGVPDLALIREGLLPAPWSIRYEAFQHTPASIILTQPDDASDVVALQFHTDSDPSNVPGIPPTAGSPLVVVPGREAIDVSSLPDLPIEPSGDYVEVPLPLPTGVIRGETGYARSWPLLARPRRTMQVSWPAMSKAQHATLIAFLRANVFFRWQPIGATAKQAFAATSRPESSTVDNVLFTVRQNVARLVYTGA